jgi:putative transposase
VAPGSARSPVGAGLVHHSDAGSQHTSFRFTTHLVNAGSDALVGSVGDASIESTLGLYKERTDQTARAEARPGPG